MEQLPTSYYLRWINVMLINSRKTAMVDDLIATWVTPTINWNVCRPVIAALST